MRPLQGRKTAASLYQGSRPSLADYALLGLSDSELWRLRQLIGRRCVPFRAEKRLPRQHQGLRPWQITPRWGCRIRNCGGFLSSSWPSMRPLQGRKTAVLLYQGSRPSLADYAPLGLSNREMRALLQHISALGTSR